MDVVSIVHYAFVYIEFVRLESPPKIALTSDASCKFGGTQGYLYFQTYWPQSENPLKLLYVCLQFYYNKGYKLEPKKERHKAKSGRVPNTMLPCYVMLPALYTGYCQLGKLTGASVSRVFIGISLCKYD